MILIDYTQIAIGSLMVALYRSKEKEAELDLVRHLVLNGLRYYRSRFNEEYGELVICCDNRHYWRRDYFPNYKANRKRDRAASGLDWNTIFSHLNLIRDEIKENFPYKVVEVYGAEADDIIAILVKRVLNDTNNLIVSSDKDFIQLHSVAVEQYSPVTKRMVNGKEPLEYLREHIIRGDRSDGVPNILSPDDTFVSEKRQKPIRKSIVAELLEQMNNYEPTHLHTLAKCPKDTWVRNWQRNETLIDFSKIPNNIQDDILREFKNVKVGSREGLFDYFIKNRLNNLIDNLGEF